MCHGSQTAKKPDFGKALLYPAEHIQQFTGEKAMWLPDRVYEALPYLYGCAGLVTCYKFSTPLGYVSGVVLLIIGWAVWIMRRDYRSGRVNRRPRRR
jgi:hypothetical protein